MTTTSTKPYFIRAIHAWCSDQGLTPYLLAQVTSQVMVPTNYVKDGRIVLNLSMDATQQLVMGNDVITFQARFAGKVHDIYIPVSHVLAVYAAENNEGMAFGNEIQETAEDMLDGLEQEADIAAVHEENEAEDDLPPDDPPPSLPRKGHLKLVK